MKIKNLKKNAAEIQKASKHIAPLACRKSSKSIAQFLESKGIKGKRGDTCNCAISVYLKKGGFKGVEVGHGRMTISNEIEIDNTDAIENFIGDFDDGVYPNLLIASERKALEKEATGSY